MAMSKKHSEPMDGALLRVLTSLYARARSCRLRTVLVRGAPWRVWHTGAALIVAPLVVLVVGASGLFADLSAVQVSHWPDAAQALKAIVFGLHFYAFFFVRGHHWLINTYLIVAQLAILLMFGTGMATGEPLNLGLLILMLALSPAAAWAIARPNRHEYKRLAGQPRQGGQP